MIIINPDDSKEEVLEKLKHGLGLLASLPSIMTLFIGKESNEHYMHMFSIKKLSQAIFYALVVRKTWHVFVDIDITGVVCVYFSDNDVLFPPKLLGMSVQGRC